RMIFRRRVWSDNIRVIDIELAPAIRVDVLPGVVEISEFRKGRAQIVIAGLERNSHHDSAPIVFVLGGSLYYIRGRALAIYGENHCDRGSCEAGLLEPR